MHVNRTRRARPSFPARRERISPSARAAVVLGKNEMDVKTPAQKRRKALGILLFVAINAAVIIWTASSEYHKGGNAQNFFTLRVRWRYLIPTAACFAAAITAEISKYAVMMKKLCGEIRLKTVYEVTLLGRYFDNITPSGIGGQPFQIYYLSKNGVPSGDSAVMPIAAFINMQTAFCILAITMFSIDGSVISQPGIHVAAYIGLLLYMGLPIIIVLFTLAPVWMEKVIRWFIVLLGKMHLVKNVDSTESAAINTLKDYRSDIMAMMRVRGLAVVLLALSLVYQAGICSMPYFVIRMFGGHMSWVDATTTTLFIYAAIAFIPTPGNAGAAEGSFYLVFSMLTQGRIFWAMLVWRFFCYYIYILWGIGIYARNYLTDRRRLRQGGQASEPPQDT
jgi:uncharacterized protein (TIRG00374 family)